MHREIPDHTDVVLEQAEVHANRIVVVEIAQLLGVDDLADLAHRAGLDEGVVDHQHEAAFVALQQLANELRCLS